MWWNMETECVRPAAGAQSPSHGQKEETCSASGDLKPPGCLSGPGTPPELPLTWTQTPACPSRPSSVEVCVQKKTKESKVYATSDVWLWNMSSYVSVLFCRRSLLTCARVSHQDTENMNQSGVESVSHMYTRLLFVDIKTLLTSHSTSSFQYLTTRYCRPSSPLKLCSSSTHQLLLFTYSAHV